MSVVSRDRFSERPTPMVDVSQHELVPEHTVLDEPEVEEVLEEYQVKKTNLPKI